MEETPEHLQTDDLLKDLSAETLSADNNKLKEQCDDLSKREQQARQEVDRLQNLLAETQKAYTTNQEDKEKAENKLADTTNLKHESMSLVSSLRQSMELLRSENSKLSQEIKECRLKNVKVETDKDAEHYRNETLKLQNNDLHLRLKNLTKSEQVTRQALMVAENNIKHEVESMRCERERTSVYQSHLEKERDSLLATVHDLRQQLIKSNNDTEYANKQANAAEQRIQELESRRLVDKKSHDDLIEVYEKQRQESEERIAQFTEALERSQQKTTTDRSQLEQDNEKLKKQLTDALDKLQVTRSSLDKLLGKNDTTTTSADSSTADTPIISGNLVKMMKQYESTGRHWDDIFNDFFDLRSTTSQLTSINNELTKTNRQLVRERDDQHQYRDLLESEVERLRTERASQSSLSDDYTKLKISTAQQITQLKGQVEQLHHTNQDLNASLNDTAYQLRYLIRHVESENGNLPAEVQQPNNLLGDANIPPTISHEKTVFRDITELQQRNQDLLTEVRHLSTQLEEKTAEAKSNADTAKENHALLTDITTKSTTLIQDQNEKIQALELRLSMTISERDRLLKQIPESNLNSSLQTNLADDQEKLQQADQKYQQLLADTEAYRVEMELELKQQREELKMIRNEATTLRQEYNGALLEIDQHKQRNIGLTQVSSSRQSEIDDLRRHATAREIHIGALEERVLSLNNEIVTLNRTIENLQNDHLSTNAQLTASNNSYQRLLDVNKDLANERGNLTTLLQDMNERLASSTTGTTHLVEELKQHNERLSRELQNLRDTLASKEKELRGHQAIDQSEWKDKYQTSVGEVKQLKVTMLDLEQKLAAANQDRMVAQAKLDEALKNMTDAITTTTTTDGAEDGVKGDSDPLAELAKQLTEANNHITTLKKQLFDVKGRLADADSTASKITQDYNTFASESQVRIDKLSDDLATSNQKVINMQTDLEKMLMEQKETKAAHALSEQQWESTRTSLTQENQQLKTETSTLSAQITDLQAELAVKVEQLQQNEDRYQTKVADHAKDIDIISSLREEIRQLNADIMASRTEVLGAQERLRSAELSYRNQKEQLETEQDDMKLRLEESHKQQEALADKIQELVAKINELQTSSGSTDNDTITQLAESATQQLRDVNASLRREKDVWYARYIDTQQRASRMESDLEFVQHQLSTTRALLETVRAERDEKARQQTDGIKDAQNEASLYKENNISLRSNVEKLTHQVTELESLLATKETEMEPLKLKAQGLEHELKQTRELVQTLKGKQEEWNARSAQLLSKHNKSDPQEIEKLKSELEVAKAQLVEKTQVLDSLEKQHQELDTKSKETEEALRKASDLVKSRGRWILELKKKITTFEKTIATQKEQLEQQEQKPPQQEQQKEPQQEQNGEDKEAQANQESPASAEKIKELEDALTKLKEEKALQTSKFNGLMNKARSLMADNNAHNGKLKTLTEEKAELATQLETIKTEMDELKQQLATKTSEASSLQVEINRMKAMHSMTTNKNEKLKKQISELQQKLQEGSTTSSASSGQHPSAEVPSKPSPIASTKPSTPESTTMAPTLPVSASSTTFEKLNPAVTIPPSNDTSTAVTSTPPHTESQQAIKENSPTVTPSTESAPQTLTNPTQSLKRGAEDDLEDQPTVKK